MGTPLPRLPLGLRTADNRSHCSGDGTEGDARGFTLPAGKAIADQVWQEVLVLEPHFCLSGALCEVLAS